MPRIRHPPLTPAQRERRSTTTFREFFWALEKSPWRGGERGGSIVLAFPSSATATNRSTGFHFVNAVAFPNDNNPRKVSPRYMLVWLNESKLVVSWPKKYVICYEFLERGISLLDKMQKLDNFRYFSYHPMCVSFFLFFLSISFTLSNES